MAAEIESPCISICTMNDDTGFCLGCYRTLEEIQDWWGLDNIKKQAIVDAAEKRQESAFD